MTDPTAPGAPDQNPGTPPPAPTPAPDILPPSDPIGVPAPEPLPETLPEPLQETPLQETALPSAPSVSPPVAASVHPGVGAPPPEQPPTFAPNGFPAAPSPYTSPGAKAQVLSILSLVAGIVAFAGSAIVFIPFVGSILGLPIPIAAIVLGFLGRKREPQANRALWLLGIILGAISLLFAVLAIVFWAVSLSGSSGYDLYY